MCTPPESSNLGKRRLTWQPHGTSPVYRHRSPTGIVVVPAATAPTTGTAGTRRALPTASPCATVDATGLGLLVAPAPHARGERGAHRRPGASRERRCGFAELTIRVPALLKMCLDCRLGRWRADSDISARPAHAEWFARIGSGVLTHNGGPWRKRVFSAVARAMARAVVAVLRGRTSARGKVLTLERALTATYVAHSPLDPAVWSTATLDAVDKNDE